MPTTSNAQTEIIELETHRRAREQITSLAELFFSGEQPLRGLRLRLFPLVVGPTGVGKSHLVGHAATRLRSDYLKVTRGDWFVQGTKCGRPTVYQILDRVVTFPRVVLHIDELDKFQINFGSQEWSASIASDLWNILDGRFPVTEYLRDTEFPGREKPCEESVTGWIRSRLWIVGSGTWQSVFQETRTRKSIGFNLCHTEATVDGDLIAQSELISPELLHRFNSDMIFLGYPNREETIRLLKSTGIDSLAAEMNQSIDPATIDWTKGGFRVLEALATRLVLMRDRRHQAQFAERIARRLNAPHELRDDGPAIDSPIF
jgi:hypothetical protein